LIIGPTKGCKRRKSGTTSIIRDNYNRNSNHNQVTGKQGASPNQKESNRRKPTSYSQWSSIGYTGYHHKNTTNNERTAYALNAVSQATQRRCIVESREARTKGITHRGQK